MGGNLYTVTLTDIAHWPKANYVDPEQRTWLPGYAIFWLVLSTVPVAVRLYLRAKKKSGSFGIDDVFIFVAWVFSIVFTCIACVAVLDYQVGRHIWDLNPSKYKGALYTAWLAELMFIPTTGFTKLAILFFYHRLIREEHGRFWHWANWTLIFVTVAGYVSLFFSYAFMCSPMNAYWDIHKLLAEHADFTCINGDALTIWTGVFTVASDFWCAALPCAMFQVHDLGVSKSQKIALNVIFCIGFLVTGVGIGRTYYLWELGHHQDLSWLGYDLFAVAVTECQLSIVCTCAPFLRAFWRRYPAKLTTRSTQSDQRSRHASSIYPRRAESIAGSQRADGQPGDYQSLNAGSEGLDEHKRKSTFSFELQPVQEDESEKAWSSFEEHSKRRSVGFA